MKIVPNTFNVYAIFDNKRGVQRSTQVLYFERVQNPNTDKITLVGMIANKIENGVIETISVKEYSEKYDLVFNGYREQLQYENLPS